MPAAIPALYRGVMEPLPPEGSHFFIRGDRRPRDTGSKVLFNIAFNLMIERRFGVPLVRRRSLFVSGSLEMAMRYSAERDARYVGIVEPQGPFRCLHSPQIQDSAALADELGGRYSACFYAWQRDRCAPLLQDVELTLAEVDRFFANTLDVDRGGFSWGTTCLRDRIFAMLDGCFESKHRHPFGYRLDDVGGAAAAGVEIMIFDCPQGYRIRPVPQDELAALERSKPTSVEDARRGDGAKKGAKN